MPARLEVFILFSALISSVLCDQELTPKVKTTNGLVVGKVESYKEGQAAYFYGIPYAQPPVGELRFQKPRPAEKWDGVLEATEQTPNCFQPRTSLSQVRQKLSEDCLYLDILLPLDALKSKGAKLPVIVILNLGGGLEDPTQILPLAYPMALRNGVILIRVNHRNNVFGYAYSQKYPQFEGNYGLWDENLALKWINNNIKNFGGDPNQLSINGNGYGAMDVGSHLVSPHARGLFTSVLMEDANLYTLKDNTNERVSESTDIVIERVGCSNAKNVLACMQDVDPEKLVSAIPARWNPFRPVFESEYVPTSADDAVINSDFMDVDVTMGYMQDARSLALAADDPQIFANRKLTYDDAKKVIQQFFEKGTADMIARMYVGDETKSPSTQKIQQGLINMLTDIDTACPQYDLAERLATKQRKGKTYAYIGNHKTANTFYPICDLDPELGICAKQSIGVSYGIAFSKELYYAFTDEDRQISKIIMEDLVDLASTGRPGQGSLAWNPGKGKNSEINPSAEVISLSNTDRIDTTRPQFCLDNMKKLEDNLIDKLYILDTLPKKQQYKVDQESSLDGILYNALLSGAYQHY